MTASPPSPQEIANYLNNANVDPTTASQLLYGNTTGQSASNPVVFWGAFQPTGTTPGNQGPGGTANIWWGGSPPIVPADHTSEHGGGQRFATAAEVEAGAGGPVTTQYLPSAHPTEHGGGLTGVDVTSPVPNLKNSNDALYWLQNGLFNHDPQAMAVRQKMIDAGIVSPTADLTEVMNSWAKFISLSAGALANGQFISPFQYLDSWANMIAHDTGAPTTETSTSITRLNPADLAAAYQQTSEQALGRRATPAEAAAAAGVVGAQAAASPTVSTTTSRTVGTHTTRNTVTQQGMGTAAIDESLMTQAMQSPEYGAYQAAGHYFPALLSAIGAVNSAGS